METVNVSVSVRPPRLMFLVKDQEQLLKSISYCSVAWGGRFNEIQDVSSDNFEFDSKRFDYAVTFSEVSETESQAKHLLSFGELFERDAYKQNTILTFLDCIPIFYLAKKEQIVAARSFQGDDLLSAFRYGVLPQDSFCKVNYRESYEKVLTPQTDPIDSRLPPLLNGDPWTPIDLSGISLTEVSYGARRPKPSVLVVWGVASDFAHICASWNLRARGYRILFLDLGRKSESELVIEQWLKTYKESSANDAGETLTIAGVLLKGVEQAVAAEFSNKIKCLLYSWEDDFGSSSKGEFENIRRTEEEKIIAFLHNRKLEFKNGWPRFLESRVKYNERQRIGIDFELPTLFRSSENDYLHSIPDVKTKERCLLSGSAWDYVRIHENHITKFEHVFSDTTWVFLNSVHEFWKSYFHGQDLSIKQSPAGHNLNSIISKYGGVDPGCRIFKLPSVRVLLNELQQDRSISKANAHEIVNRNWPKSKVDFGLHFWTPQNLLSELCESSILRQGYRLKCSTCMNSGWYSLSELDDDWRCGFCSVMARTPLLENNKIEFKANGLFQIPGGVSGAITNILALWRLNHLGHGSNTNFLPSFEIFKKDQKTPFLECDLLVSVQPRAFGRKPDLVLVEGKSSAVNGISERVIEQMSSLGELFDVPTYKCFATTKSFFSENEIKVLKDYFAKEKRLILFAAEELNSYETWDVFPGFHEKYIGDVATLSRATIFKYLKISEPYSPEWC